MDTNALLGPFCQMLDAIATPEAVRAIERGSSAAPMWDEFVASGFLDALVAEADGGAGLHLAEVGPLWQALGRYAVPLPVAETMVARAMIAAAGAQIPDGAIAFATSGAGAEALVPFGRTARHVMIDRGDNLVLAQATPERMRETGVFADTDAWMTFGDIATEQTMARPTDGLRPVAALIRAALIAGAAARLLEMSVGYANERVQFGKPIGRQQALQQNLAVMAEDAVSSRIAVELACAGGLLLNPVAAATAKSIASTAAPRIANTAHAVHGAIGISEEHDLQLFTRRLHGWRLADGSETYWNRRIGALRLAATMNSVDWARSLVA